MISDRQCCDLSAATYDSSAVWDYVWQGDQDDDVYITLKKTQGYDVISARGSDCELDWLRDGDAVPYYYEPLGYVHSGFFKGILSAYADVKPLITQPVVLDGHSLGGSHAQELAALFTIDGIIPAKVCCFGSPKVGYQKFAEVVAPIPSYTLYKNGPDYVTDVPLTLPNFPFVHARPLTQILEIPFTNDLSLFAFHKIVLYQEGISS
jgi:pimeloyl-ACP methyl ester carboxylesterase